MVMVEAKSICANCSACSLRSLNNGFYRCRRFDIFTTLNDTCEARALLESKPIRYPAT